MRENYDTSGPGEFEGEPPIVRYLWQNDYTDEESGNTAAHKVFDELDEEFSMSYSEGDA